MLIRCRLNLNCLHLQFAVRSTQCMQFVNKMKWKEEKQCNNSNSALHQSEDYEWKSFHFAQHCQLSISISNCRRKRGEKNRRFLTIVAQRIVINRIIVIISHRSNFWMLLSEWIVKVFIYNFCFFGTILFHEDYLCVKFLSEINSKFALTFSFAFKTQKIWTNFKTTTNNNQTHIT